MWAPEITTPDGTGGKGAYPIVTYVPGTADPGGAGRVGGRPRVRPVAGQREGAARNGKGPRVSC